MPSPPSTTRLLLLVDLHPPSVGQHANQPAKPSLPSPACSSASDLLLSTTYHSPNHPRPLNSTDIPSLTPSTTLTHTTFHTHRHDAAAAFRPHPSSLPTSRPSPIAHRPSHRNPPHHGEAPRSASIATRCWDSAEGYLRHHPHPSLYPLASSQPRRRRAAACLPIHPFCARRAWRLENTASSAVHPPTSVLTGGGHLAP